MQAQQGIVPVHRAPHVAEIDLRRRARQRPSPVASEHASHVDRFVAGLTASSRESTSDVGDSASNVRRWTTIAGAARRGVVGGASSLFVASGGPRLIDTPEFPEIFKFEAESHLAVLEALRPSSSDADWFYVSSSATFGCTRRASVRARIARVMTRCCWAWTAIRSSVVRTSQSPSSTRSRTRPTTGRVTVGDEFRGHVQCDVGKTCSPRRTSRPLSPANGTPRSPRAQPRAAEWLRRRP